MCSSIRPAAVAIALGLLPGCSSSPTPQWFTTCGDPVCQGYTPPAGVAACTPSQTEGAACGPEGSRCDPHDGCNRLLVCSTTDPQRQNGGCPISHASAKRDIRYLDPDALDARYAELRGIRLATYRYRDQSPSSPDRLGFILDDRPPAACVREDGDTVDLYGYTSLTAAAVQAQARRIDALEKEVAELRAQVRDSRR